MTRKKKNPACDGVVVELWRPDNTNYTDLLEIEQRLYGQFQHSINLNDREPSRINKRAIYAARDAWLYAHDRLIQAGRPA